MNYTQLTEGERYQISQCLKLGLNQREIAAQVRRHPSTIGREIKRNTGLRGYRPKQANLLSDQRKRQSDKYLKMMPPLRHKVEVLLRQEFSPEQAAHTVLKRHGVSLHHETIYRFIYADKANGGDIYTHLRVASKHYQKRYGVYEKRGTIIGKTSIEERPAIVDERVRIGDWEADTVIGKGRKSALLTLVERKTLYTIIFKLKGKHAYPLASKAIAALRSIKDKVQTITVDNGLEFADHQRIADALDCKIYCAHPYCSWERGTNENTNGLIRQYFPKGTDFNLIDERQIKYVMHRLNNRPRKTRDYQAPNVLFYGLQGNSLAA
ncbi:MAG: IS30 family transposase [Pseudomonadota bacterium]